MSLKVVHKKLPPKDEVKALWENIEKKFWDRQSQKVQNFLTGTRDVKGQKGQLKS